jgi:hypothetical protein
MSTPLVPRAPKLRRDVPSLPRFDRIDRRLPHAASTSPAGSSRTITAPSVSTSHPPSSAAGPSSARGRRPSHGGQQLPGHSAGNHHVRQPSPIPSSASSSGDSEREDDDAYPSRRASGLAQYGTGGADGARWRAARKKGSRSGRAEQAKFAMSGLAAVESSSAPGGESDAFGGSLTEEAWTPAVERQPEASTSGRPGWSWAMPDFARSRRASPAVPSVELPDAATFAQLLDARGATDQGGGPLAEQQSPSSGSISPTVTLDGALPAGSTPPGAVEQLLQRGRHPGSIPLGPSLSQRSGRLAPIAPLAPVFPLALGGGSWQWQITRTWMHSALVVAALGGASYEIWKEGVQEDRYCVFGASVVCPLARLRLAR